MAISAYGSNPVVLYMYLNYSSRITDIHQGIPLASGNFFFWDTSAESFPKTTVGDQRYLKIILFLFKVVCVFHVFRFGVMADFQYLPPDMPDFLKQVTDADALNQVVPFHLQPPVFTRFDHPTVYNYNPEPQTSRGCKANQGDDLDEERYKSCTMNPFIMWYI